MSARTLNQGRYELKGIIGRGGNSEVWEAYDNEGDQIVAVKVLTENLHQQSIAEAMFDKEVAALKRVKHPTIIDLKHHFHDDRLGSYCLVLERVPNAMSLLELIQNEAPRGILWILETLEQVVEGLDKAHGKGVVHRDLSLNNILLGKRGDDESVKIVDFGVAKLLDTFGTSKLSLPQIWTYPFVSPEHTRNKNVRQESDRFVFGIVMASMLTWQIPQHDHLLEEKDVEDLLEPLSTFVEEGYTAQQLYNLVLSLTQEDPDVRPHNARILRILREARQALTSRPSIKVIISNNARDGVKEAGFTDLRSFLKDINTTTLARYYTTERGPNIYFYGKNAWAHTVPDAADNEQLVMVAAGSNDPDRQRLQTRGASFCTYRVEEGRGNAYDAMNDIYLRTEQNTELRKIEQDKRNYFKIDSAILEILEGKAKSLDITYDNLTSDTYKGAIQVEVTGVTSMTPDGYEEQKTPEEVVALLGDLDKSSKFTARVVQDKEKVIGRFIDFNLESMRLTIDCSYKTAIPTSGELGLVDAGALTSVRRQRRALNRFIKDNTVNPRLGELILRPRSNDRGLIPDINLIQELDPPGKVQELVGNALAAQDFYLIQGPPGTGKTTLIVELIRQILLLDRRARILVTAQPNEAVNEVFGRLREQTGNSYRDLLITKGAAHPSSNLEKWSGDVIKASKAALETYKAALKVGKAHITSDALGKVEAILDHWHERLPKTDDVLFDYARSVQIFGATCLTTPKLTAIAEGIDFDYVIVDEAAKALGTEVLTVLVEGKKFILVGDQFQLPPYIDQAVKRDLRREGFSEKDIETSLFQKMFAGTTARNKTMLDTQYRMHSSIGTDFVGRLFYGDLSEDDRGGLATGANDKDKTLDIPLLASNAGNVFWIDVAGKQQELQKTFYNAAEVLMIDSILRVMNTQLRAATLPKQTVAVIAPYSLQVSKLIEELRPASPLWTHLDIKVATVDSFQGKEADIGIFSLVRTSGPMRFLADRQRLNVSWSRSKKALIIFGHLEVAKKVPQLAKAIRLLDYNNIKAAQHAKVQ